MLTMHFIIGAILIITIFLSFIEESISEFHKKILLACYIVLMIIISGTKDIYHTADAEAYQRMFLENDNFLVELTTEPTFIYLSRLIIALGGDISILFFIYAFISIPQKMFIIYRMTPFLFTALVIYIPIYYELHDIIQIRAAAAASFLFVSIYFIVRKRKIYSYIAFITAILFHYSSIAFTPMLIAGNRKMNMIIRISVANLIIVAFALYFLKLDLFSLIPSFILGGKLDFYIETAKMGQWDELSKPYMDLFFMGKCAILYLCLIYYDYICKCNKYAPIVISMLTISIFFLLSMATVPVIASRVSDLYGIVDCIAYTFLLYIVAPKFIARSCAVAAGVFMYIFNIVNTEHFF